MTTRRFPNRIFGDYPVPYEVYKEQLYPFGQVLELPAGQIFRFGRMGGTIGIAANLYQSEVPNAQFGTMAVQTAMVAGDTSILYTNGTVSITENEFTEGTIIVESAAALGHIYPVKSHGSGGSGATITAILMDGVTVQAAVTTSEKVTALKNPWLDTVICTTANTAMLCGVPQLIVEIAHHSWFQTHGFASVRAEGAVAVVGKFVRRSETTAGTVTFMDMNEGSSAADDGVCGVALQVDVTGDHMGVFLKIE